MDNQFIRPLSEALEGQAYSQDHQKQFYALNTAEQQYRLAIHNRSKLDFGVKNEKNQQATCDKIQGDFHAYSERLLPDTGNSSTFMSKELAETVPEDNDHSSSATGCLDLDQRHNPFLSIFNRGRKTEDLPEQDAQQPQLFVNFGGKGSSLGRSADEKNHLMQKLLRLEDNGEKYQEQLLGCPQEATLIFAQRANQYQQTIQKHTNINQSIEAVQNIHSAPAQKQQQIFESYLACKNQSSNYPQQENPEPQQIGNDFSSSAFKMHRDEEMSMEIPRLEIAHNFEQIQTDHQFTTPSSRATRETQKKISPETLLEGKNIEKNTYKTSDSSDFGANSQVVAEVIVLAPNLIQRSSTEITEQQDSHCNAYPEEDDKIVSDNEPSLMTAKENSSTKESKQCSKQSLRKRVITKTAYTCISEVTPIDCKRKRASGRLNIQSQITSDTESKPVTMSSQSKRIQKKRGSKATQLKKNTQSQQSKSQIYMQLDEKDNNQWKFYFTRTSFRLQNQFYKEKFGNYFPKNEMPVKIEKEVLDSKIQQFLSDLMGEDVFNSWTPVIQQRMTNVLVLFLFSHRHNKGDEIVVETLEQIKSNHDYANFDLIRNVCYKYSKGNLKNFFLNPFTSLLFFLFASSEQTIGVFIKNRMENKEKEFNEIRYSKVLNELKLLKEEAIAGLQEISQSNDPKSSHFKEAALVFMNVVKSKQQDAEIELNQ